ncbi:hypothetical protein CDL12_08046 [Handroanthus impetiginosus]|uniref:Uncharacterized protein n=1 Tax=Handroanthus impetiginosus TaxID=429701 RepID=A0A2G9HP23_9LAMI|nr:hypothetical protein CDL12_08046 [Handroanthus impetiginosus]
MSSPHISVPLFCGPYNKSFIASPMSTAPVPYALLLPKISTQLLYNGCGLSLSLEVAGYTYKIQCNE